MNLRRRGYLVEQDGGAVKVSVAKYVKDYDSRIRDLIDYSMDSEEKRWNGEFPRWMTGKMLDDEKKEIQRDKEKFGTFGNYWKDYARGMMKDAAIIIRKTKNNMNAIAGKIKAAIGGIESWTGSNVFIEPAYNDYKKDEMSIDPINSARVTVFKGMSIKAYAPGFAWFGDEGGKEELDDVLDAGDRDFFTDPELEADYFSLVNEIRHPGRSKSSGKILKLYTARPKEDRAIYVGAKEVPSGIFLTSKYDSAIGIGQDLSAGVGRDVYLVKIADKNTIKTLDTPGEKQYQAFSRTGKVPVVGIELM